MNRRLPAFTILELTVSMLLAALVISITYAALQIVTRSYQSFGRKNEELAILVRLDQVLRRDISASQGVYKTEHGIVLPGAAADQASIRYEFDPEAILRKTELVTDTFKVAPAGVRLLFEGKEVQQETGEDGAPSEASRADELGLELLYKDEKYPYHYYKIYSSENLINRTQHAYD
jgi:hypothetical protein